MDNNCQHWKLALFSLDRVRMEERSGQFGYFEKKIRKLALSFLKIVRMGPSCGPALRIRLNGCRGSIKISQLDFQQSPKPCWVYVGEVPNHWVVSPRPPRAEEAAFFTALEDCRGRCTVFRIGTCVHLFNGNERDDRPQVATMQMYYTFFWEDIIPPPIISRPPGRSLEPSEKGCGFT